MKVRASVKKYVKIVKLFVDMEVYELFAKLKNTSKSKDRRKVARLVGVDLPLNKKIKYALTPLWSRFNGF